jgi:hypothetical protein
VVRKVLLPKEAWDDAWCFLTDAGINEYLLFPDLDGLTGHLHRKYRVNAHPAEQRAAAVGGRRVSRGAASARARRG